MSGRAPVGGARQRLAAVLTAVGAAAVAVPATLRLLSGESSLWYLAVAVGVVLLVLVAVVAVTARRTAAREAAVRRERAGSQLHGVFSAAELGPGLVAAGVWERRLSRSGGTPLTLAASPAGVELWRGAGAAAPVVSLPWSQVASVRVGTGLSGPRRLPAVVVETMHGAALPVLPARGGASVLLPGGERDAARLVAALHALRDGVPEHHGR